MADNLIRQANGSDIPEIMRFIKDYWLETHILANDRDFFEYQYVNCGEVCFCLSEDPETFELQGILGYIPYGKKNRDVMSALWKVKPNQNAFLGVKLLLHLIKTGDVRIAACNGINKKTFGIYNYVGYSIGTLDHYYRLADREEYRVASVQDKRILPVTLNNEYSLVRMNGFEELNGRFDFMKYKDHKPFKEPWFIEKRYFNHPVYAYDVFGIENKSHEIKALLMAREQNCNGAKILRFVDCIGEAAYMQYISADIQKLIDDNGYEYIDFYQKGIAKEMMEQAGFTLKTDTGNIIPNYFEPFVRENIEIDYCTMDNEDFKIFKGDGDQDRPNWRRSQPE